MVFCRPGFTSTPMSSMTSLKFLLSLLCTCQKFQSSDFPYVIRGRAYMTLLCVYCELRAYVWMYLWLSLSAVTCWVRKTGWWECPTKPSGFYKYEWDSLNYLSCFHLRIVRNRNVWGRKLAEAHSVCARENIDWMWKQLREFLEDSSFCST